MSWLLLSLHFQYFALYHSLSFSFHHSFISPHSYVSLHFSHPTQTKASISSYKSVLAERWMSYEHHFCCRWIHIKSWIGMWPWALPRCIDSASLCEVNSKLDDPEFCSRLNITGACLCELLLTGGKTSFQLEKGVKTAVLENFRYWWWKNSFGNKACLGCVREIFWKGSRK